MQGSQSDPFGTAELRRTVLDAWAASPARFREDANAEEDYALGGYRDRVIVELAQNAADAAARAGVPGRLRLALTDGHAGGREHRGAAGRRGRRRPVHAAGLQQARSRRAPRGRPVRRGLRRRRRGQRRAADRLRRRRGGLVAPRRRRPRRAGARRWPPSSPRGPATLPVLRLPFAADGAPPRATPPRSRCRCATTPPSRSSSGCSRRPVPRCSWPCPPSPPSRSRPAARTRELTAAHDGDGVTITADGVPRPVAHRRRRRRRRPAAARRPPGGGARPPVAGRCAGRSP